VEPRPPRSRFTSPFEKAFEAALGTQPATPWPAEARGTGAAPEVGAAARAAKDEPIRRPTPVPPTHQLPQHASDELQRFLPSFLPVQETEEEVRRAVGRNSEPILGAHTMASESADAARAAQEVRPP
jgi:hypothetical protein